MQRPDQQPAEQAPSGLDQAAAQRRQEGQAVQECHAAPACGGDRSFCPPPKPAVNREPIRPFAGGLRAELQPSALAVEQELQGKFDEPILEPASVPLSEHFRFRLLLWRSFSDP